MKYCVFAQKVQDIVMSGTNSARHCNVWKPQKCRTLQKRRSHQRETSERLFHANLTFWSKEYRNFKQMISFRNDDHYDLGLLNLYFLAKNLILEAAEIYIFRKWQVWEFVDWKDNWPKMVTKGKRENSKSLDTVTIGPRSECGWTENSPLLEIFNWNYISGSGYLKTQ